MATRSNSHTETQARARAPKHQYTDLRKAYRQQILIGWDNAFLGYLSVHWGLGVSLLRAIVEATYQHHNTILHDNDAIASANHLNESIQHHYSSDQTKFLVADQ